MRGAGGYRASCEAECEAELRHGVALLCCLLVPLGGPDQVLLHPAPLAEAHPGVVLRRGVAQMRGTLKDSERLRFGNVHAPSRDVADPDLQEGFRVVEPCGLPLDDLVSFA